MSPEFDQTTGYVVVNALEDDTESMSRMLAQSWLETYPNKEHGVTEEWVRAHTEERQSPEGINKRKQRLKDNINNPDIRTYVIKNEEDEIIGLAVPIRSAEGRQNINGFYIDKIHHGTGAANKLMEKVIQWADPNAPIYLEVAVYNERAKSFYKKWGFTEIPGSEKLYEEMIPEIVMVRGGVK